MSGVANVQTNLSPGHGAQFWAYISPQNKTAKRLVAWRVDLSNDSWKGSIDSDNPQAHLQTPNLSGIFDVKVTACLDGATAVELTLQPSPGSQPRIGCDVNCAAMIGIVVSEDGRSATYWTTWDAMFRPLTAAA